jgi:hypothetical protein
MPILKDLMERFRFDLVAARRLEESRKVYERRLLADAESLLGQLESGAFQSAGQRDLVMGLAIGYGEKELAPFVVTLRESGFDGEVVLLTHGGDPSLAAFLRRYQVRMVPFVSVSMMPMSMNSARMFRYLDWLLESFYNGEHPGYRQVLLCDVRDVVFQGNPFAEPPEGRLSFYLETARTIAACPVNADWMHRAFGPAVLAEVGALPVSCAGTLLGSASALLAYLVHMVRYIIAVPPEHRFSGVDQAIHNYILAKKLVQGSIAVPNAKRVMTVPSTQPTGLTLLENGTIVNPDKSTSAIVHQYDRDPKINSYVNTKMYA